MERKVSWLKIIGLVIIIILIGFFFVPYSLIFAPALIESNAGNNNYFIKISGLENLTASGETIIMIPLPAYIDGEQVFSDNLMKRVNDEPDVYRLNFDWNLSVENTPYGNMMVLKSSESELSDLNIRLAEFDRKSGPRLLMPVVDVPEDLTLEEFSKKEYGTYESLIYISGTFDPVESPVVFDLQYKGGGGKKFCFETDTWKSSSEKSILPGDTGFSNITVNYIIADSWY